MTSTGGGIKKYVSVFSIPYLQQIHTCAKHMVQEHSAKGAQVPARTGGSHSLQTTRKMATPVQTTCGQLQPNKGTCRIITLISEDILCTWKLGLPLPYT